jgi:uncharacterized membrane protein
MQRTFAARTRTNFLTGLAVALPVVISLGVVGWVFGTVANFTDSLLFFLPRSLTHTEAGVGPVTWYWSIAALGLALALLCLIGQLTRYYVGKQMFLLMDTLLLRVPLLGKVYGTLKQVNEAFSSSNKSSFQQVVLVEFPRAGMHSVGFVTNPEHSPVEPPSPRKMIAVFIPTTPNPTSGFLVLVPEDEVVKVDMSVADGIKFIISLGAIAPEMRGAQMAALASPRG